MATLELISYSPERPHLQGGEICWQSDKYSPPIENLPVIAWKNGEFWSEANSWALELARSKNNIKTVISNMQGLLTYAKWLEIEGVNWWHFPQRSYDRCLNRYRGALIGARDRGELAPSTISNRMSVAVRFYRWARDNLLLHPENPMWKERQAFINFRDCAGFERAIKTSTTDLNITNRKPVGIFQLEDGLMPVTLDQRNEILSFASKHSSDEFVLMLRLGFFTGMRLGSICDLKEATIQNATLCTINGFNQLSIGPRAMPPVNTKMSISGRILIPSSVLEEIEDYLWSNRRLLRKKKANWKDSSLVFLNRDGKPYEDNLGGHSAINTELSRLRKIAEKENFKALKGFKFHRTRATFATMLMQASLDTFSEVSTAIKLVRDACLHKNDATTLGYISFIEQNHAMSELGGKFSYFFMGSSEESEDGKRLP